MSAKFVQNLYPLPPCLVVKYESPLRTSKERTVGPNGASLLLQSTGEVLVWLPKAERERLTQEVSVLY